MEKRKYNEDIDGVSLMHLSFPEEQDQDAANKTLRNRVTIKTSAKVIYYKNKLIFDKIGMRIEDVESILMCNTYVAFSKDPAMSPKILSSFLKQRGIKLANRYKGISEKIVEDLVATDEPNIESLMVDNADPETIMMAKEEFASKSKEIQRKLVNKSAGFIKKFIDNNRLLLDNSNVKYEDVVDMVSGNAIEFASVLYQTQGEIKFSDFSKFRASLAVKMNRFVKELKTVNG